MMRSERRAVPIDLASVRAYGVARWQEEFFWPISDETYLGMCREIEHAIEQEIARLPPEQSEPLLVVGNGLVFEYQHFLHAVFVLDALTRAGDLPMVDDRSHWYAPLARGNGPCLRPFGSASASPLHYTSIDRWLVLGKQFLKSVPYNIQTTRKFWRWMFVPSSRAMTIGAPTDVVARYCSRVPYAISIRYHPWSSSAMAPLVIDVAITSGLEAIATHVMERIDAIARSRGVALTDTHRAELLQYTLEQLRTATVMLHHASRAQALLTYKHFFSGNLRDPMQRALAIAMRHHGGHVTSFTHGGSLGLFDSPTFHLSEFRLSDVFVAYTKASANLFAWVCSKRVNGTASTIAFRSSDDHRFARFRASFAKTPPPTHIRRVLYVGDSGAPWRRSLGSARFALMHLDLERRLCALLLQRGYEVVYKAHPDHAATMRSLMEDVVPVRVEDFRQMLHEADAYIFGNIRTTAFPIALCTNKPVIGVLLEDERARVHPEAFAALRSRCSIIFAQFDERQRIVVPEDALLEALATPARPPDMAFVETYMIP